MSSELAKQIVVAALEDDALAMREHVDIALSARAKMVIEDYKKDFSGSILESPEEETVDLDNMTDEEFQDHIMEMDNDVFEDFCIEHQLDDEDVDSLEEMRAVDDMVYSGKTKGKKKNPAKVDITKEEDDQKKNDVTEMAGDKKYYEDTAKATPAKRKAKDTNPRPGNYFGNRGAMKKHLRQKQDDQDARVYGKKGT